MKEDAWDRHVNEMGDLGGAGKRSLRTATIGERRPDGERREKD